MFVAALVAAVVAVVASAAVAVGAMGGGADAGHGFLSGSRRAAPKLPGTVVNVSLANMGGSMMGSQDNTLMGRGAMRLIADRHFNRVSGPSWRRAGGHPEVRRSGSIGRQPSGHGENG